MHPPTEGTSMTGRLPTFDDALAVLAGQNFSALVGAELIAFGTGAAALKIPLRADLLQQHGVAHGGVLAYAADNAITFAAGSLLGADVRTTGVSVAYIRPAAGAYLVATATVVTSTSRSAVCSCEVVAFDEDDQASIVAIAQGTVRRAQS